MEEIALDTGKICFGMSDTMTALEMGAVEELICWENLEILRVTTRVKDTTDDGDVLFLRPPQLKDSACFKRKDGTQLEMMEADPFTEWIVENYKSFGTKINLISDKSQEGAQFVKGFGGIGGLLRYKVDFEDYDALYMEDDNDSDEDDFM